MAARRGLHTSLASRRHRINPSALPRIESARRVLDEHRETLGDFHPSTLTAMGQLADALRGSGCKELAGEATILAIEAEQAWRFLGAGRIR
eukprot:scaffold94121_cov34-Tisochrysis_lutea.AAC.3